jgi:hypothetical protein
MIMPGYETMADLDALSRRLERRIKASGGSPSEQSFAELLGSRWGQGGYSVGQRRLAAKLASIGEVESYERGGKVISGYRRSSAKKHLFRKQYRPEEEEYIRTHTLQESRMLFRGKYTDRALFDKRSRLLGKKK